MTASVQSTQSEALSLCTPLLVNALLRCSPPLKQLDAATPAHERERERERERESHLSL